MAELAGATGNTITRSFTAPDGTAAYALDCPTMAARIRLLDELARFDAERDPVVIHLARTARAEIEKLHPEDPKWATAAALHQFVKTNVRFVPEAGELFQPSDYTLKVGIGDCDDSARLLVALLRAAGLQARLMTLGAPPTHVSAGFHHDQVGWVWLETTIDARPGEHPLNAARRLGVTVRRDIVGT
jgi:transglutaminase-like putative cysteine protease